MIKIMFNRKHGLSIVSAFTVLTTILFRLPSAATLIPADNPLINYYGRFDFSEAGTAVFNWSGAMIEAAFSGKSIGVELVDGNADYAVEIDGQYNSNIQTKSGVTRYDISESLSDGQHTIRLVQKSEQHWNGAQFKGFYVDAGTTLSNPPSKPVRKIEFIGDSYTVGYGNESAAYKGTGNSRSCSSDELRLYTNTDKSFGRLVADAFHAQALALGWSGAGMVRNYGYSGKKSEDPYPSYYGKTLGAAGRDWDFTKWVPDLAVICLGTNDFSTTPYPDDTMYSNAYHNFISKVRSNYGDIPLLCVATHTGPMDGYLKKIVADEKSVYNNKNTFYAEFPETLGFYGCDWHPTTADDSAIAKVLTDTIMSCIGWDTAYSSAVKYSGNTISAWKHSTVQFVKSHTLISLVTESLPGVVSITDLRGNLIVKANISSKTPFLWNTSNVAAGTYLIRNSAAGFSERIVVGCR